IEEVSVSQDPPPGHLFELLKALADPPGTEEIAARLQAAGADRITVRTTTVEPLPSARAPAAAPVVEPVEPELEPQALDVVRDLSLDMPVASESAGDALAQLERNPGAANAGDLLHAVLQEIDGAMRAHRPERAMRLVAAIARCEQLAPDDGQRRQYAIVLKRAYSKAFLQALAQLVTVSGHRADAIVALQRAGADGVEVLLDLLVAAPTVAERQAIFGALADMKEGTDPLVHMLAHQQWFVVRNVAELVGELGLEEAVPGLANQLDHEDERVRKAVALALAKIGTGGAADPIRRALRDPSPGVRMQVALGVGGRKSTALAMPLMVALEEEQDAEVQRELLLALGRIGSADAVQALIKFARPAGRLFGRRSTALRVATVEALRVAATPAAVGMLQGLAEDADKEVRSAAQAALKDVKRG
ncbi:MAG TPA: HEAT repeat domain-containing protein, partial [Methylomirabilota bacterium]|nr:HEAT repeat domain-containing protein [Methylomirabilota bacterium]